MKKGDLVSLRKWDWVTASAVACYYHVQFGVLLVDITSDSHFCEVFDGKNRVWWDRNCIFPANAKNFVKQYLSTRGKNDKTAYKRNDHKRRSFDSA